MTENIYSRSLANGQVQQSVFKLTPSDFAFQWEDCRRCFYLKVVHNLSRPWSPMPKIFTRIHSLIEGWASGRRTEVLARGMPPGIVEYGEQWVESTPIFVPGRKSQCFIRGRFDTIVKLDDRSYAVIDFKTCARRDEHLPLYSRQLHAYMLALDNPAQGKFSISPITRLGLLVWEPSTFSDSGDAPMALSGNLSWVELPVDVPAFMEFLSDVLHVLEQPLPPAPSPNCQFCTYREVPETG